MSAITVIYIVTAAVSIAIAWLLVSLARASAPTKITFDERKKKMGKFTSDVASDESLRRTIFEEINEVVESKQRGEEISKTLTEVFNKELEKRVDQNLQELTKKYETLVKDKSYNEDIAWKKYKKVLSEKKDTEAVIHSIAEGLVVLDAKGKVIMMNPAAEKMLGIKRQDKVGRPLLDNLKEEQLISLVKDTPDKENREIELVSSQDETKKILRASTAVIENENGNTVGIVSVLSDVTKQKELEQMKSNFLASVSHELRSPLVAMGKSISLILDKNTGPINETQEQFLSIADRNIKRLGRLINDLLDLTKLEAGKLELKPQPQSIEKIINECVEGLVTWAKTKSINIEKKIQEGLPEVNVDADRIIQVLTNLIGNAIKFTPNNGNITVEAVLHKDKEAIEVSVKDTGIGIDKENLTKVFDKFYQVGERTHTDISGTGIGLSIAKEIVELHGGNIWAESEKGYGAKFIFTLPLKS